MLLEVNGVQYDNFQAASCELRLDALANLFSFEAIAAEGEPLPFKGGESCRVIINGKAVLTGSIEIVDVSYSAGEHNIMVQGRDKTADLLDSSIDVISDLSAPITLKAIIEKVIASIGSDVKVVEDVATEPFNAAEDIAAPEPGDNAFNFIEKYARKRQVLLTSDGDDNVVITSGSGAFSNGSIQHIIGASDNNVIESSFSYDVTGRYNVYKISSQQNPVALNVSGVTGLSAVTDQSGGVFDNQIRAGRQLVLNSETSLSDDQAELRARWEANIRKARGLVYSATVMGFGIDAGDSTSDLWNINTLYQIVDDYVGKSELMLANSITFTTDVDGGEGTALSFVDQNAYSLTLEEPQTNKTAALVLTS